MRRIYKYRLTSAKDRGEAEDKSGVKVIEMSKNAEIISCQLQDGFICIWALAETNEPIEKVMFIVCPTGFVLDDGPERILSRVKQEHHVGTVITQVNLVWHVFKVPD